MTEDYIEQLHQEKSNAEEALNIVKGLMAGADTAPQVLLKRKEAAELLNITMDTLRNWELNGLLTIRRKDNGYRVYSSEDIRRIKIIKALRCANYSLSSILRMLNALSGDPGLDIKAIIGMPVEGEDIITACDKLLVSLDDAEENALYMKETLRHMKKMYSIV